MAKRDWLIKEHNIYRLPGGGLYCRESIPELGRKEFAIGHESKFKNPDDIVRAKRRVVADIIRQNQKTPKALVRCETLAANVVDSKKNKDADTYVSAELTFRKHLIPWLNDNCPYASELNEDTWEEYIAVQMAKPKPQKIFNHRKHMSMLVRLAHKRVILDQTFPIRIPHPRRDAGKRLTRSEIQNLIRAAGPTLKIQLAMALTMGMRKSEILLLSWDRVDLKKRTIHLRRQDTKIRKARTMGMSDAVFAALSSIEKVGPYVFPSRYNLEQPTKSNKTAWGACKLRAGVKCRFHDARHSWISEALLTHKMNPLHVAVYAGVSLSEIERTYLHPTVDDTRYVTRAIYLGKNWGKNSEKRKRIEKID